MAEETDEKAASGMPRWVKPTALAVLVAGVLAYVLIAALGDETKWGPRGDAVGPFAALFNAGALFAALWAVHLQRSELALQRQELRETREEMVEQRKQFERTAGAQEALAASQALLAEAQVNANREAACLRLAQHSGTVASLDAALASMDSAGLVAMMINQNAASQVDLLLATRRQAIGNRIDRELKMEEALQALLTQGAIHAPIHVRKRYHG